MKVMIANDSPTAHYYIRLGLARAFTACGHECVIWDIKKKSAFDAFDEFRPDLFIGQTFNCTPAWIKCIENNPQCRVIMKASDWGTVSDSIDRNKFPILIANQQEIDTIAELKEKTGKPDFIYVHYMQKRLKETHNHWDQLKLKKVGLLNAADIFDYTKGKETAHYKSDIAFIGGRWGYKSQTFDKWLLPLLSPKENYNVKIFGNQAWGVPQYCGRALPGEGKHILASAKICPNLSEPHSQVFGYDIVERPFKILSNKCLCVSDYVEDAQEIFGKGVVFAKTPQEFKEKIDLLLDDDNKLLREEIKERGYKTVMNNHTYFHRIATIFENLNMTDEQEQVMDKYKEIRNSL